MTVRVGHSRAEGGAVAPILQFWGGAANQLGTHGGKGTEAAEDPNRTEAGGHAGPNERLQATATTEAFGERVPSRFGGPSVRCESASVLLSRRVLRDSICGLRPWPSGGSERRCALLE